ncbi:hypothetical protein [Streptomyces sp. NPDC031705]|uniref:hypothetical protein n=1 Tax=Streptomyces sp. NPDC031705 TaxID=3155729 RepID=UPI0033CD47B9
MDLRSGMPAKRGVLVLIAAIILTGCGPAGTGGGSPVKASSSPASTAAAPTRDSVEADVVAALRKAGIDPATGRSTPVRNGMKRPDMFDWFATVKTPAAQTAWTTAGAELERLGWVRRRDEGTLVQYKKGDWSLLSAVMGPDALSALQEGDSVLSFTATKHDSADGAEDAS